MKIAVINEVSACAKNGDIANALSATGHETVNIGMFSPDDKPSLTYIHTGLMSALILASGAADFVVSGCGTGQGYLNSVLQYPGVTCALISEPLDAWLAKRINAVNCVSLPLNKGYGWASDINLKLVFEQLFSSDTAKGYPPSREESQAESRAILAGISGITHRPIAEILGQLDPSITGTVFSYKPFTDLMRTVPGLDERIAAFL